MKDIGTLAGGSGATGISNQGHIVGYSDASVFIYRNGVMIDLNQAFDKDALASGRRFRMSMPSTIKGRSSAVRTSAMKTVTGICVHFY